MRATKLNEPIPSVEPDEPLAPEEATKDDTSAEKEAEVMYSEYVHGVSVNQIAAVRRMEAPEVLAIVTTVEQNRNK